MTLLPLEYNDSVYFPLQNRMNSKTLAILNNSVDI